MSKTVVLACSILLVGVACFAQSRSNPQVPTVTYLEGTVTIDGVDAGIGDTVPLGATVRTAASSIAEIAFNRRNAVRLSEDTTFVFNPANMQTGSELRQGALTLVLKSLVASASGDSFLVRTPSAVAGVRGTSFFLKVESPTSTYVCACNGDVHVLGADGASLKDLAGSHHKAVRIEGTGGAPQVSDSTLLYHTDADLEKVATDVGVTIDWSVVDK
jgi:hypothetical protein